MFDSFIIEKIVKTIDENVVGMHVQKIFSDSKNSYLIKFSSNKFIKIDLSGDKGYINYLNKKSIGEAEDSQMIIFLRRYLQSAKLVSIEQLEFDRIIKLDFLGRDEVYDKAVYRIYIELIGRHSNLIVTNSEDKILYALKYTPWELEMDHRINQGIVYATMKSEKNDPRRSDAIYSDVDFKNIKGFHKRLNQLVLDNDMSDKSLSYISNLILNSNDYYMHKKDNHPYDFYLLKSKSHENYKYDNLSDLIEDYYENFKVKNKFNSDRQNYIKLVKTRLTSLDKKLVKLNNELNVSKKADTYKLKGELLQAYQHSINNYKSPVEVLDYYTNENILIEIDTTKSIIENSNRYYKRYQKLISSKERKKEQIEITKEMIDILNTILYSLETIESSNELDDIIEELYELKIISRKRKNSKVTVSKPLEFIIDNIKVRVGKNNIQNDNLTFKTKNKNYIWLHVKDIPGSHVVVLSDYDTTDDSTLIKAAKLAAYYSKAKNSNNVPVDYTRLKDVKKKTGSKPGFVNYFNQKTLYVKPTPFNLL